MCLKPRAAISSIARYVSGRLGGYPYFEMAYSQQQLILIVAPRR
jgi:hypothetical protein